MIVLDPYRRVRTQAVNLQIGMHGNILSKTNWIYCEVEICYGKVGLLTFGPLYKRIAPVAKDITKTMMKYLYSIVSYEANGFVIVMCTSRDKTQYHSSPPSNENWQMKANMPTCHPFAVQSSSDSAYGFRQKNVFGGYASQRY
jgi:hypothetical protein